MEMTMRNKIIINVDELSIAAELFDTPTARRILEALPLEGQVNTWGDEIYFMVPIEKNKKY